MCMQLCSIGNITASKELTRLTTLAYSLRIITVEMSDEYLPMDLKLLILSLVGYLV